MRTSDEANFFILFFFVALLLGGWKLLKKIFQSGTEESTRKSKKRGTEESTRKSKKGGGSGFGKPFFVKSLTRRRRLDLNRKGDNILSGKLGKKMDRHRKGMFGN